MTYNPGYNNPPPQQPSQGGPKDGGYLYPNDKKIRAEQPDQKGKIKIGPEILGRIQRGETEFYISAWNKQDGKGQRFQSVKLKGIDPNVGGGGYGAPRPQQPQYAAPHANWQPPGSPPPSAPQYAPPQPQWGPQAQGAGNAGPVGGYPAQQGYPVNPSGRNVPPAPGGFPNDDIPF